jgi:hypothetical protein
MRTRSDNGEVRVDLDSLRLDPGSHASPRDGVCLLELTSMIAEEPFSDRPRCVCVVIAAFLRGWNDRSSHAERQQLRPYARRVVGSRARRSITRRRRDICLTWAGADLTGNWVSRAMRRFAMRLRIMALCGVRSGLRLNEGAGDLASRVVFSRYGSEAGLRLVGTLLEVGADDERPSAREVTGQDALARAVVEAAIRDPKPLDAAGFAANGSNGHANGSEGNGRAPEAERIPAGRA